MTEKSVAVYVRVSTDEQNTEGQRHDLQRWIERNAINPASVAWYEDRETGTKISREHLNRLQADIFAGTVKTVIVWKLDRISRKLIDGITTLAQWVEKGVRVVSVTQQIDVSGVLGQTLAAVLFGFAQLEHQYRAERQAVGIAAAKRRGVYTGRKVGTVKADPSRARELRVKGLTLPEVATALGCSARTVARYLATDAVGAGA